MKKRKGTLYVVATPLGNLADITHRAVEVLSQVQWIAAEDTRHSRVLLDAYGIRTPCVAYHEHNETAELDGLLEKLKQGDSIALISDAGTPLISDPGFSLVRKARELELPVVPVPGANAMITALCVSGLPTDRFVFEGFLPAKGTARRKRLEELSGETRTLVFYESSHRIVDALQDLHAVFGAQRNAVVARELTKLFETVSSGTLAQQLARVNADADQRKGEFVILVHGRVVTEDTQTNFEAERVLRILCAELPPARAAALAAQITGAKKNALYPLAVEWAQKA
ncbi:MAG: 16S rRNA (cytidine(1402)-2'-O)-methyltransferase [Gammaproteobacteria bacterium]|nr:16S rRNA (cytidine(1402)-2'-O)-methyltransferase [Gammaproteobacteria bacterium]